MAQAELASGQTPDAKTLAQAIITGQAKEIATMQGLLAPARPARFALPRHGLTVPGQRKSIDRVAHGQAQMSPLCPAPKDPS